MNKNNKLKIFISASMHDIGFVNNLKCQLEKNNFEIIVPAYHMPAGISWVEYISKSINLADYALIVMSSHYNMNDLFLLGMAQASKGRNFVIGLKIEDNSKILSDFENIVYFDFSKSFEHGYFKLIHFLEKQQKTKENPTNNISKEKSYEKLDVIKNAYNNGNLVLVCGAGISYDAGIPTWNKLLEELLGIMNRQQLSDLFQNKIKISTLILGKYLKIGLEDKFTTTIRDILYQNCNDKSKAIDEIIELSRAKRHRKTLKAIITFNFDDLIEEKMKNEKIDYKTIFTEGERFKENEIPIYHPHGFLPRNIKLTKDNDVVFSEDTYHTQFIDPYSWGNLVQLNYLSNSTCLFVGISLTDPNMRRLLDVSMRKNWKNEKNHYIIKKRYNNSELFDNIKKDKDKILNTIEYIEEQDANVLGLNVIWVNEFSEIPEILNKIYSE